MVDNKKPKNKITIYRVKRPFVGNELLERAKLFRNVSDDVIVYCEKSVPSQPSYISRFFKENNGDTARGFFMASSKFVVLVKNIGANKEELAFTFGSGRYLLNQDCLDSRFGLKTALNIINRDEVKNFSKTVLESNPKSAKEQLAKTADASEFGISSEQDLIKGITGKIKKTWTERLGEIVTGAESLSLNLPCDIDDIHVVAANVIQAYECDEYKKDFDWVDQIQGVKDKDRIADLNVRLVDGLNSSELGKNDKIWASVPDYVEYSDIDCFVFGVGKNAKNHDDIEKSFIVEALNSDVSLESLKKLKILAMSNGDMVDRWSAYRCLYAEITIKESIYLLIDGRWYEIAKDFCKQIKDLYEKIPRKYDFIDYQYGRESEYNEALADNINGECFDAKNVTYGSSHSKIEVCDVLTSEGDLIHVKHYTGSSALSHLFNQGFVSGELIRNDKEFITEAHRVTGGDFSKTPEGRKRKIIFAIITRKPDNFDMPFFSKVTLRNVSRQLTGLDYDVEIQLVKNVCTDN